MRLARFVPLLILALAACGSDTATGPSTSTPTTPDTPTAGWLTVQLSTPNTNDGAVQFAVSGPEIDSVAVAGYDGFATNANGTADIVADGQITSGDVARIYVPDVAKASQYTATIAAAAARDTYELQATDGYRAIIVR